MVFGAALLDVVVLNALAFVNGRVAVGLDLELIDCIDRDGGPHIARVAIAAGTHERNAVDVNGSDGAAAAGAVDDAGVGGGVAVGVVGLHAGHEEGEVGGAALVGLAIGAHLDGKRGVDIVFHGRAQGCVAGLELRRCGGDVDGLGLRTYGKGYFDVGYLERVDVHVFLSHRLKTWAGDSDGVDVRIQRSQVEVAGARCCAGEFGSLRGRRGGDGGLWNYGAAGVDDGSFDLALAGELRVGRRDGEQDDRGEQEKDSGEHTDDGDGDSTAVGGVSLNLVVR